MNARPAMLLLALACGAAGAPQFYDDDPLLREPSPLRVGNVRPRKISDWYDFLHSVFAEPGQKQLPGRPIPSGDINTIGEVLEGAWYQKRHGKERMSTAELRAGPGNSHPPADGPWIVISAKTQGVSPGFEMQDTAGRRYFVKFDPPSNPEMETAADVIGSKFFYALGYHVPENYIVHFARSRLKLDRTATYRDSHGRKHPLTEGGLERVLRRVARQSNGLYRASASLVLPGEILDEFRFYGTRTDDPNDIVPHEHRRMLRGLQVFCAWLNHEDSRAINTLDTLVEEQGLRYVKHHLIDFGSSLGSGSVGPNSPRAGYEQLFTWHSTALEFFTFGLYVPKWARIRYPELPSVGRFSAEAFDPVTWTPEYPNPAFDNRLEDDVFWAAAQVMCFTDPDIRAIVSTGQYSDHSAERHVAETLIRRRDAIGRAYLTPPLSLDRFRVENGLLSFDNLADKYGFLTSTPAFEIRWSVLDNETGAKSPLPDASGATVPRAGQSQYLAARITAGGAQFVTVYVRRSANATQVVGIDRVF